MPDLETGAKSLETVFGKRVGSMIVVVAVLVVAPLWLLASEALGWWHQGKQIRNEELTINSKFIEIAVGILQNNEPDEQTKPIREWAANSLQFFSEQISEDNRVRLTDTQVSLLSKINISISGEAIGFSKANTLGWALISEAVEVLEGSVTESGLPANGSMVRLNNVSIHTEPYDDDEYGVTLMGRFDVVCAYVRDSRTKEGGSFLLISPESLSRCARLKNGR